MKPVPLVIYVLLIFVFTYGQAERVTKEYSHCNTHYENSGFTKADLTEAIVTDSALQNKLSKWRMFFNKVSRTTAENIDKVQSASDFTADLLSLLKEFGNQSLELSKSIPIIGLFATVLGIFSDYKAAAKEKRELIENINKAFLVITNKVEKKFDQMALLC